MSLRGMLMTVGFGGASNESLLFALKKSIDAANPDVLGLISSKDTQSVATKLADTLPTKYRIFHFLLTDENNIDKIFVEITEFIGQICLEQDCDMAELRLDFTSGTKAMSAGAVLAAIASGVQNLLYIAGERVNGTVQKGLEEIKPLTPTRYHAIHDYRVARQYLTELRFSSALSLLKDIPITALPYGLRSQVDLLNTLVQAYQSWDLFQHRQAGEFFKQAKDAHQDLQALLIPQERITDLYRLADSIAPIKPNQKPSFTPEGLADLYNNAVRRLREGKFDDACARLYRLTEMCAQYKLHGKGINTSRLLESQVPKSIQSKFRYTLKDNNGPNYTRIALQDDYELLYAFNEPLGYEFKQNSKLHEVLYKRNQSILAHGVTPVDEQTCRDLFTYVRELILIVVPNFDDLCRRFQFPWLVEELMPEQVS